MEYAAIGIVFVGAVRNLLRSSNENDSSDDEDLIYSFENRAEQDQCVIISMSENHQLGELFGKKYGFPNLLEAIDGTHIRNAQPKEHHASYINRKGFHSIQTQLVCDQKLKIIHAYCGQAGSAHDARNGLNTIYYVFACCILHNICIMREYLIDIPKIQNHEIPVIDVDIEMNNDMKVAE
ncbi:Similar to harbi1: Putative nuclease HARBI1 (Danio rerio) [Cotesia congregata]|uniref:Similar to harbi1: Putative nuclease HARBI1 (Danio rerio) n=1 Tax=Cotesia congregata TaxID=51543 RepID=A0A8J2MUQ1_COTCN|nr:Similar to harbi1: Putative nuclease HARBI1 (Danio rerio) [Cotesia congregata]